MDREGIEDLYRQYGGLVYRTCLAILVDHHDAEDAAQEIFAKLLSHDGATVVSDPRKWLLQVTRNHCIDRRRAAARRRAVAVKPGSAAEATGGATEDAEKRSVARAQIQWLLSALPRRQREVMVRQAVLDEDLNAVATKLGITYGAAAQLVHRARRLMLKANEGFGAGVAVVTGHLSGARGRLRALCLRPTTACREALRRMPAHPALALPAVLVFALLATAPAGNVAGPPQSGVLPSPIQQPIRQVDALSVDSPPAPEPSAGAATPAEKGAAASIHGQPASSPGPTRHPLPVQVPRTPSRCVLVNPSTTGSMTCFGGRGLVIYSPETTLGLPTLPALP
jgi:RNA polymerase sigma-70 factor, ECF subfamily